MLYRYICFIIGIFFFQAEDGIRYGHVTGVQTCALPIFALPALKQLSKTQHQAFRQTVEYLIAADGRVSLMEWALSRIVFNQLEPRTPYRKSLKLRDCQAECALVLSLIVHAGARDADEARGAFQAGDRKST